MPASTDFGADPFDVDPTSRIQIFRRRTTVIFAGVFAVLAITLGLVIGVRDIDRGSVAIATIACGVVLAGIAVIMGVWPHVALHKDRLAVHNSIFWFEVPYESVSEMKATKLGLVVRTYSGKLVPVTAYASGSGKRVLGHADAAEELIRAVHERIAYVDDNAWRESPRPRRRVEVRNLVALLAGIAIAVILIVLAAGS